MVIIKIEKNSIGTFYERAYGLLVKKFKVTVFPETAFIPVIEGENPIPVLEEYGIEFKILSTEVPYPLVSRQIKSDSTAVRVGSSVIGDKNFTIIAGPCAIESWEQAQTIASFLKSQGIKFFRGGAFKPRTSPYSFQGLQKQGIKILKQIKKEFGFYIVTELIDLKHLEDVMDVADIIQVGSRSMYNYTMLKELAKIRKPVLLKRNFAATITEFLLAAEYLLWGGNEKVILCERGIKTFENSTRASFDIQAIPVLKRLSHLPVIADPSHSAGDRTIVPEVAWAQAAAGAMGIMVEVHQKPDEALSDGRQSLDFSGFTKMLETLKKILKIFNKSIS